MKADVVVLGAGVVGVAVALHLQMRGRAVVLVDKRTPGEETSFGNAGLIQREGVYPYGFPHDFGALVRYATNRTIDAHYHASALPKLAPFLWKYWMNSRAARHEAIAREYATLIAHCVSEHEKLAQAADASNLLRPIGWMKIFRTPQEMDARLAEGERWWKDFGIHSRALDRQGIHAAEPFLSKDIIGGLHFTDPLSVSDPHALTMAYLQLFERLGGQFVLGDGSKLEQNGERWSLATPAEKIDAGAAVVALGPWADLVTKKLGYDFPLAVKRGYHMHYKPQGNAVLNHPMLDIERGYFIAPMAKGVRLTTGAEFANRDAPKTPVQLERAEPIAKALFPLGERLDEEPWMGCRPCTPDMKPVLGAAPNHKNLWFSFGHAHHGLTLAAVTGRLISEMICGDAPFVDPAPFLPTRDGLK